MIFAACCDISHAGRFDIETLSNQHRMELFITPSDYDSFCAQISGDIDDACTWTGVTCDSADDICDITWHSFTLQITGNLDFLMIPRRVLCLNIYEQEVTGVVDLMHLPVDLNILCIEYTSLSGTLDLSALPRKLDQLFFTHNAITSVKDLVNIPETLRYFAVNEGNVVENSIVIGKKHMEELTISFDGCGFKNVTFVEGQENDGESFLF